MKDIFTPISRHIDSWDLELLQSVSARELQARRDPNVLKVCTAHQNLIADTLIDCFILLLSLASMRSEEGFLAEDGNLDKQRVSKAIEVLFI